ncbi:MAG: sigma-70 family RNA polymerase sigma factor [Thermocrispum sp.]
MSETSAGGTTPQTPQRLRQDVATVQDDFVRVADPFRRELLAHCYRMLGSVHDAEDLVQETYIRAWRAYHKFEGRSSLRTWLYTIATRTCLTALEGKGRRELPTDLAEPTADPSKAPPVQRTEVPWLEPIPDAMITTSETADPAALVATREHTRLALLAAMQHLPPRQRAVLILREVLRWKAAEVAEALEISTAAVNSILQRARAQIDQIAPTADTLSEPDEADERELLDRYVKAFESYDIDEIVRLFTDDAVWEMPPYLNWARGASKIGELIAAYCPANKRGDMRLRPTVANGQPAFGLYMRDPIDNLHKAFQLQVLSTTAAGVAHAFVFFDLSLFDKFGLPQVLDVAAGIPAGQQQSVRVERTKT